MIDALTGFLVGFGCGVLAILLIYHYGSSDRRAKGGLPIAPEAFKKKARI
jgi:hypothetical protein